MTSHDATQEDADQEILRLVAVERLSQKSPTSTSVERQDAGSERYAAAYGHTIVDHAPDSDISGDMPMWERPEAGKWLNDPAKLSLFDGFIFSVMDRLGRNARHISAMRDWAEDHHKKLIIISPPLQWPPADGDLASPIIWDVLARLAEYELRAITKRNRETRAFLEANGLLAGRWPYGYMVAPKGKNKTLVPDPELKDMVEKIFAWRVEGLTYFEIAQQLTSLKVLTPYDHYALAQDRPLPGKGWNRQTVRNIVTNPLYKGTRINGKGQLVLEVEAIIGAPDWYKAQAVSETTTKRRNGRRSTRPKALLAAVLKCGVCGGNMSPLYPYPRYGTDGVTLLKEEPTYYCHGKESARRDGGQRCKVTVNMAEVEAWVAGQVAGFGEELHMVPAFMPAEIHLDEIKMVELQIRALDQDAGDYDDKHTALRTERKRLVHLDEEAKAGGIQLVSSGKTIAREWDDRDQEGRREFLLDRGCEVHAVRVRGTSPDGKKFSRAEYSITWRNYWPDGAQAPEVPQADD